jgi:hypothetical protein
VATGVNVSKGNLYGALSPPAGETVSKANLYGAFSPPLGVNVSKAIVYAVVSQLPVGVNVSKANLYAVLSPPVPVPPVPQPVPPIAPAPPPLPARPVQPPNVRIAGLDIQFQPTWDPTKANKLKESLEQILTQQANQIQAIKVLASTPATTVPVHELADASGLGPDHTVAGLTAGQVLKATGATTAKFDFLKFAELAGVDPNSLAAAANGSALVYLNGYWSAVPLAAGLGLVNPGGDALVMWDASAGGGAGGLTWALQGAGITITSGRIAIDDTQLTHGHLLGLLANDHPQYALLAAVNSFVAAQTFLAGLVSARDITLLGNLEQSGAEPEQRIQNTDDAVNEGTWRLHAEPGQEMHAAVNDDGSDAENWLAVQRTGDVVDTVAVEATSFTFNGFDVCCGELVPGAGAMPPSINGYITIVVGGKTIKIPYLSS